MKIEVRSDADSVAREARASVAARGRFIIAVSGGRTPWTMLHELSNQDMQWEKVHVVQVDERVAPAGHPDRNFAHLSESLSKQARLPVNRIHAMPVETSDLEAAAAQYAVQQ